MGEVLAERKREKAERRGNGSAIRILQLSIELTTEGLNCRLLFTMDRHFKLIAEIEPELVLWPHCGQEGEIRWLQR